MARADLVRTLDLTSLSPAMLEFWTERHLGTLTTLRADGSPHVVPVGVTLDLSHQCAWVITNAGSVKARHLATPGRVAACQVDGGRWSTLEGVGLTTSVPEEVARAVELYAARYRTPRVNPSRVALRIEVGRVLGSASLL